MLRSVIRNIHSRGRRDVKVLWQLSHKQFSNVAISNAASSEASKVFPDESKTDQKPPNMDLEFLFQNHDLPSWARNAIDLEIINAPNVDTALSLVEKYDLTTDQVASLITCISKLTPSNIYNLISDSRFNVCLDKIVNADEKDCRLLFLTFLNLLHHGLPLNHSISDRLREKVESCVMSGSNFLPHLAFAKFVCFYNQHDASFYPKQKSAFQVTIESYLAARIEHIYDVSVLLLILNRLCIKNRRQDDILLRVVCSRLLVCLPNLTPKDMVIALKYTAATANRYPGFLKPLCARLVASLQELSLKHLMYALASLNQLNYVTPNIALPLISAINSKINELKKPVEFAFLVSQISIARLRNTTNFSLLIDWLNTNKDNCRTIDLVAFITMTAKCNLNEKCLPEDKKSIFLDLLNNVRKEVIKGKLEDEKFIWLNYVWSMAVINQLTTELARTVLNKEYLNVLLKLVGPQYVTYRLKILNVFAATKYDNLTLKEDYQLLDPTECPGFLTNLQILPKKTKMNAIETFLETLNLLAPKNSFCKVNVFLPFGYAIDAEIHVDNFNNYVPVSDWATFGVGHIHRRIAFLLTDYTDVTVGEVAPTGLSMMTHRHLTKMGYHVVRVPVSSVNASDNLLQRVSSLREMISNLSDNTDKSLSV